MKSILVFQHVPHEILGTLHPLLKKGGFRIRYANFGREPDLKVDVDRYDGLVILGGPMGVYDVDKYPHLNEEMRAIREAIVLEKPILGVCLGAQLIAGALGVKVEPGTPEIGWFDVSLTEDGKKDPVLGTLKETEKIFQWHCDAVKDIPSGAKWLARSPDCPYQAFRYGERTYGFQFHLEVDEKMIERWLKIMSAPDPERVRKETPGHIERLKKLSHLVFSKYLELFSTKRRKVVLGSGHR